MRLIQKLPNHESPLDVAVEDIISCEAPVNFIRFRYQHHAGPSGYDRIADYVDAPTVTLPNWLYWAGETVLRPYCLAQAKWSKQYEYSRYDCIMESAVFNHARSHQQQIYHFLYGEKSLKRFASSAKNRNGHRIVATVHHPIQKQSLLFKHGHNHFQNVDLILTMDEETIPFWREQCGHDQVFWVPHGIDTSFFVPLSEFDYSACPRIVFAGQHERDIKTLLIVIESLNRIGNFQFDLITSNRDLSDLANRYENIHIYSRVSDECYRDVLQQAAVLLLPLLKSTVCNVVLEAFACGTPVVTTAGGIEVYLEKLSSVVCELGDVQGYVTGVQDILDRKEDSRQAARQHVLRYSWSNVATNHVRLYESL